MQIAWSVVVVGTLLVPAVAEESQTEDASPVTPQQVKAILDKSASFELKRYPISFWNYTSLAEHGPHLDEAAVAEWAEGGFTVPQGPAFDPARPEQVVQMRAILDWCQARDLKVILHDPRGHAQGEDRDGQRVMAANYDAGVRAAAALFGDHPAVFGLAVGDEPDARDKESFFACYRRQKELVPQWHPFANLLPYFPTFESRVGARNWPEYLDEFCQKSRADLLCYDCYAQMNPGQSGWHPYFANLRLYREAAWRNGIPFWNTLLSTGHYKYRCPNYDELRWQFNTTVACGAHGVSWFFYYQREPEANYRLAPVDEFWNRTTTYDNLRRVQMHFHRLYGDLFLRLVCTKVMFQPTPYGGGAAFAPDALVARLAPDDASVLVSEFVDAQGRPYVMLVNLSMTESQQVRLTLRGKDTRVFSWNWQGQQREGQAYSCIGRTLDEAGLTLTHFLAPGQETVYRVAP